MSRRFVIKRNGKKELMDIIEISKRLNKLLYTKEEIKDFDISLVVQKFASELKDGIETSEIDNHLANICQDINSTNMIYKIIAIRLLITNHQKNTKDNYYEVVKELYYNYIEKKYYKIPEDIKEGLQKLYIISYNKLLNKEFPLIFNKYFRLIKKKDISNSKHLIELKEKDTDIDKEKIIKYKLLCMKKIRDNIKNDKKLNSIFNKYLTIKKEFNPLISKKLFNIVEKNKDIIQKELDYKRDFRLSFFGFRTLERAYLLRESKSRRIIERPQHMIMRVVLGIWGDNLEKAFKNYHLISQGYYTPATPTLFNSGTNLAQLSSCFLFNVKDDLKSIYGSIDKCAMISKTAGGLGGSISNIRPKGSLIRSTNGESSGIVPMARVFNETAKYVNQGGKRKGSIALYLELWHPDIFDFINLRENSGDESKKARDLFIALWICDLFMKRVKDNKMWSLFNPDKCPGLTDTYGDEFENLYESYEEKKMYIKQVSARDLLKEICRIQGTNSGMPYMCYKDSGNKKSNQKNIGIINSSNLCAEIFEPTIYHPNNKGEVAVCNLHSISLKMYVKYDKDNTKYIYDFKHLYKNTLTIFENLDKVIDVNYYPIVETRRSNMRHRPVGLGVQGLADTFALLKLPFESKQAFKLNREIFETIYFAALTSSNNLAKKRYEFFENKKNIDKIKNIFKYVKKYKFGKWLLKDQKYYDIPVVILADLVISKKQFEYIKTVLKKKSIFHNPYNSKNILNNVGEFYTIGVWNNKKLNISWKKLEEYINNNQYYESSIYKFLIENDKTGYISLVPSMEEFDQYIVKDYKNTEFIFNKKELENYLNADKLSNITCVGAYSTFTGSPFSKGILQFHQWNKSEKDLSGMWNWKSLIDNIKKYGTRNSQTTALMPTASTSQILGNNECFEPFTSNIYQRTTLAGYFTIINKYLIDDLIKLNLWNETIRDLIIYYNGSIKQIVKIPLKIKRLYKTVWEMKQSNIVKMAVDRGIFIDQSQSLNIWMKDPSWEKLYKLHMFGWQSGLKTGLYYLRTRAATNAIRVTINPNIVKQNVCNNEECCLACGS